MTHPEASPDGTGTQTDEVSGGPVFSDLRAANVHRQSLWDAGNQITLAYRGNEMAGEVGEACNVIKKLERERIGIRGSRATKEQLAEELADVVICADLIAMHEGIDLLGEAVPAKFNATSEKVGLPTRLAASVLSAEIERLTRRVEGLDRALEAEVDTNVKLGATLAFADSREEDGLCFYCGEKTESYAGDPGRWPLVFAQPDGTGIARTHHVRCVIERLASAAAPDERVLAERERCLSAVKRVGRFIPEDAESRTAWQSGKREGIEQAVAAIRARSTPDQDTAP